MKSTERIQAWMAERQAADQPIRASSNEPSSSDSAQKANLVLDDQHQRALAEVIKRTVLSAQDLRNVVSQFRLMPWACMAKLNEWTTDKFGDLLMEGEDRITVNQQLVERIRV